MRSAIDSAGRIVVPKALRDAAGLTAGSPVDITLVDGRIEIETPPIDADVAIRDGLPVIEPRATAPELSDEVIRTTLESTRR